MKHCHGAAGFDLLDNDNGAARDGAAEEFPVSGDGVGLVSGSEMFSCYAQEDCGHVAAIGDWEKAVLMSLSLNLRLIYYGTCLAYARVYE